MVVAIGVLALIVAGAVLALTQLDLGDDANPEPRRAATTTTTAAPTTTTSAPRGEVGYTVQQGDTLIAIARRFHVTTGAIVLASKLTTPDRLTVGQALTIPPEIVVKLVVEK